MVQLHRKEPGRQKPAPARKVHTGKGKNPASPQPKTKPDQATILNRAKPEPNLSQQPWNKGTVFFSPSWWEDGGSRPRTDSYLLRNTEDGWRVAWDPYFRWLIRQQSWSRGECTHLDNGFISAALRWCGGLWMKGQKAIVTWSKTRPASNQAVEYSLLGSRVWMIARRVDHRYRMMLEGSSFGFYVVRQHCTLIDFTSVRRLSPQFTQ